MFIFAQHKYLLNLLLNVRRTSFPVLIPKKKKREKEKDPIAIVVMKINTVFPHKDDPNSEVFFPRY